MRHTGRVYGGERAGVACAARGVPPVEDMLKVEACAAAALCRWSGSMKRKRNKFPAMIGGSTRCGLARASNNTGKPPEPPTRLRSSCTMPVSRTLHACMRERERQRDFVLSCMAWKGSENNKKKTKKRIGAWHPLT